VALYSNYAFRRLNTRVSVFSFYEAATDPIFQPLDLFEFSLQFGCGSQLELRDDFVCVEIYAHEGNPGVKFAGFYRSILLLRERISDTDYRVPERRGEVLQFEEPGGVVERFERLGELGGGNRWQHAFTSTVILNEMRASILTIWITAWAPAFG